MFTGIIQELGTVKQIKSDKDITQITIYTDTVYQQTIVSDSISVNGVCLTVTRIEGNNLFFDCMRHTLINTNLSNLRQNDYVNLEASLKANERIGGHFVTGHIDGLAKIIKITKSAGYSIELEIPKYLRQYIVQKGSVALDGVSLTVAETVHNGFKVYLIPHTLETSTLGRRKEGEVLNLECDILAKYIRNNQPAQKESKVTLEFLSQHGLI